MKLKIALAIFLPVARTLVELLRAKDANSTGFDDAAADQIDAAISSLEKYIDS